MKGQKKYLVMFFGRLSLCKLVGGVCMSGVLFVAKGEIFPFTKKKKEKDKKTFSPSFP